MSPKNYKSSQVYLERILVHIHKIKKYKNEISFELFNKRERDYDAICMQLSQVGENISKLEKSSERLIEKFPHLVNWKALKGLRNRIDHDYTWLEADKVWSLLEENLEELENGIKEILKKRFGIT